MSSPVIITEENIFELYLEVLSDDTTVDHVINSIRYQGFDPKVCRASVMAKLNAAPVIGREKLSMTDILASIAIYLLRGTKVDKIKAKTSADGLNILNKVISVLEIKFVPARELKPDDVTLSRLSASFPELVSATLLKHPEIAKTFDLPISPGLCFPAGASLIPSGELAVFNIWKKWAFEFNKLINPRERSLTSPSSEQLNFWRVTFESQIFGNTIREKLWDKLNLGEGTTGEDGDFEDARDIDAVVNKVKIPVNAKGLDETTFIKSSEVREADDTNSRTISNKIVECLKLDSSITTSFNPINRDLLNKPRVLTKIMTALACNTFIILERSNEVIFTNGDEIISNSSGDPMVINFVSHSIYSRKLVTGDLVGMSYYRLLTEAGVIKIVSLT